MAKIYLIKNNKNKNVYVGMTRNNVSQRFAQHIDSAFRNSSLKRNIFYREIVKSGENVFNDFSTKILEECDESIMRERESYYIGLIKPEYNEMCKRSYVNTQAKDIIDLYLNGKNVTEIRKIYKCKHILITNILKENNIKIKRSLPINCKKVYMFDEHGCVIKKWNNAGECGQDLGIDRGNIRCSCVKNTKENILYFSANGFYFKYNNDIPKNMFEVQDVTNEKIIYFKSKKALTDYFKKKFPNKKIIYSQLVRNRKSIYKHIVKKLYKYRN